jgi:hypothetical protein
MRRSLVLLLIALLGAAAAPARAQLTTLLDSAATLDPAELEKEQSRLLAWLNDPATTITAEQMPQVREHLYFLIGSAAQAHRRATGELFPTAPHADLASLYAYASRLGLYGAGLVARALGDTGETALEPVLPGAAIRMEFAAPYFTLRSESNRWSLRLPYYFMVSGAETNVANNGIETEALMLSTLFGKHRGLPGHTQATVMLVAARPAESKAFIGYWLRLLAVAPGDTVPSQLRGATTYRSSGGAPPFEKEIVALERGPITVLVGYIGLPGTYEANRADFLALLESLEVTP